MNFGSRKSCDIIRYISKYRNIDRTVLYNANKLILLQQDCVTRRKLHRHCIASSDGLCGTKFLVERRIVNLCPRFYGSYPPHKVITLPNLSPTMETGSVLSWGRKEGESVAEGDLLAEIETDKATMSMDASDSGIVAKILVPAGTKDIPIGTPLCVIVENDSDVAAFKDFTASAKPGQTTGAAPEPVSAAPQAPSKVQPASGPPAAVPVAQASTPPAVGERLIVSPYARTLATERGIDLATLAGKGSGPAGRIRASDLDQAVAGAVGSVARAAQTGPASYSDASLSSARKDLVERLTASQAIPDYNLTMEVRVDRVLELRAAINKRHEKDTAAKLSLNDFVIKAAAVACLRVPECNSSWQGTFIRQYNQVDVSVAVATDTGLITQVVFAADTKGLRQIHTDVAQDKQVQSHEAQGGTFSVSNLGMHGVTEFTATINPPQACLLAVGGSQQRLVEDAHSATGFARRTFMSVTLCCDHRIVDGAVGARWLKEFKENMEDPANMLL